MNIKSKTNGLAPQPIQEKKLTPEQKLDNQIRDASKMYEKQFLGEMMRAMRKTVQHSEFTQPSMAEKIYQDEMYDQYTEKWMESGGNGLSDQIYRELKEKILPSQYSKYVQQQPPKKKE